MADTQVSIGNSARPEVNLRQALTTPSVVARPIPITTPGTAVARSDETDQLLNALNLQGARLAETAERANREGREDDLKKGQLARTQNQLDWADAVAQGKVDAAANPWFIKGYHQQDGRVAGLDYYTEMRKAYANSDAKGSDDPKVFEKFKSDFTQSYMASKGKDKSTDWWDGFRVTSDSAQAQLNSEHASQAEQAIIAKQEANTGAEINLILNGTKDPAQAGAALNELKAKMKLMGMPEASFDKVAAEAVLAKAKLGDPGMLETLKHVKTGDSGTLASNPKVAAAAVDTSNAIKEQQRADTRWAWASQDRAFTLQSQQHARESWEREKKRNVREDTSWDRQDRARALTTTIILGTMANPADYRNATKEDFGRLVTIDPDAAEKIAGFQERFTTRQETVPEATERPVRAQLQQDVIRAAGNPALQQEIQLKAVQLGGEGKLNKETVYRIIDDAQRFWSMDPTNQRKLQDPQVERVRSAARQFFIKDGQQSISGPNALDALAAEQVIDKDVLDFLNANPNATGQQLSDVAAKALERVLPAASQGTLGTGKVNETAKGAAAANAKVSSGPENPPPATLPAAQAVAAISAADKQEFLRQANEAHAKGSAAFLDFISSFDQRAGIPGLAQEIIKQTNEPPKPTPVKKR